jgi:hypothetical protein
MANLRTSLDIIKDALWRAGETQSPASNYWTQALVYLNRGYQSICSGGTELDPEVDEAWWWLRKSTPGVLTLQPSVNTITASIASGATALTYSDIPEDRLGNQISLQGCMFSISQDNGDIYRILDHTIGQTTAELDSQYTGVGGSGLTQRTIQFQYPLAADVKSIVGRMRCYQAGRYDIDYADVDPMRTNYPLGTLPCGVPRLFSMVAEQTCEFSHYLGDNPTDVARVEYDYLVIPADLTADDSSLPLIPFQYVQLLSDYTAFFILEDKDDSKSTDFLASAKTKLQAMAKESRRRAARTSNSIGKIMPRAPGGRWRDGPPRTQSGLIIGGG